MTLQAQLGHLAIRGRDPEALAAFYTRTLGFKEMFRMHWDDGRLRLIYLRISDDQYLEILPNGGGEGVPPPDHMGVDHFCLTVDADRGRVGGGHPGRYSARQAADHRRGRQPAVLDRRSGGQSL